MRDAIRLWMLMPVQLLSGCRTSGLICRIMLPEALFQIMAFTSVITVPITILSGAIYIVEMQDRELQEVPVQAGQLELMVVPEAQEVMGIILPVQVALSGTVVRKRQVPVLFMLHCFGILVV